MCRWGRHGVGVTPRGQRPAGLALGRGARPHILKLTGTESRANHPAIAEAPRLGPAGTPPNCGQSQPGPHARLPWAGRASARSAMESTACQSLGKRDRKMCYPITIEVSAFTDDWQLGEPLKRSGGVCVPVSCCDRSTPLFLIARFGQDIYDRSFF